jgi:hypothetical protein
LRSSPVSGNGPASYQPHAFLFHTRSSTGPGAQHEGFIEEAYRLHCRPPVPEALLAVVTEVERGANIKDAAVVDADLSLQHKTPSLSAASQGSRLR